MIVNSQVKNLLQVFIIVSVVLLMVMLAIFTLSWFGFTNSEEESRRLNQQALEFQRDNKYNEALRTYDEVVARYGDTQGSAVKSIVVVALFNKGDLLERLDRSEEAIDAYDAIVTRLGDTEETSLKYLVIWAMIKKGDLLGRLEKYDEAIAAYDSGISRFGDSEESKLNYSRLARYLIEKAALLDKWGKHEESISAYDEVVTRFGSDEYPLQWDTVALALNHKGAVFEGLGKHGQAISAYDEVLMRFWDAGKLAIKSDIMDVLISKGDNPAEESAPAPRKNWRERTMTYVFGDDQTSMLYHAPRSIADTISGEFSGFTRVFEYNEEKETTYDDLVKRDGEGAFLEIRGQVVDALSHKGLCLINLGKQEQCPDKKQARYSEGIVLIQQAIDDTFDSLQRDGISLHWLEKKENDWSKRKLLQHTLKQQNSVLGRQYYNLACARVLSESLEAGFDQLTECLTQKQITWTEVENDPCWDGVRGHQRYQELQKTYGEKAV